MNAAYLYEAKVIDVYDGDTITCKVDLGFHVSVEVKFRLFGIDTPELRGHEREEGVRVRDIVRERILNKQVLLKSHKGKTGKYGRWLAEVLYTDEDDVKTNLNLMLVAEGNAQSYFGGSR